MNKQNFFLSAFLLIFIILLNYLIVDVIYTNVFRFFSYLYPPLGLWKVTTTILSLFLATLIIFTAVVIILERRDPAKTLAWLLVLIFLPLIGFILYLIFGRQVVKRRKIKRKRALNTALYPLLDSFACQHSELLHVPKSKERLINLILNNADFPITFNNSVQVLTDGEEIYSAFLQAIATAREHIHLETYILRDDQIGNTIIDLLLKKVQAGVQVRLIYDGLGSRELSKQFLHKLKKGGIQVAPFFPVRLSFLHNKINYRNHRKILIVDNTIGFLGGANIGDEYLGKDPQIGYWRDTQLQVKGDAVYFIQRIFLQDWYFITEESLENKLSASYPVKTNAGCHAVQITSSGPDTYWEPIMQVYYYAIATAEKSIYLTSPYFVPNESILTALKTASLAGIDVKILVPAKTDHKIVSWAAMSYLEELMETGIEVYLYKEGFIHSKVLIVDGMVASIGSANMDQRSFKLNFEVNAFVYNQGTAAHLEKDFLNDLQHSELLSLDKIKDRTWSQRILESGSRLLSPLL